LLGNTNATAKIALSGSDNTAFGYTTFKEIDISVGANINNFDGAILFNGWTEQLP